jgi:hypothetical protein
MGLAGGAEAYTHHPSTPAERAQTRALNEEQLQLAQQENTGLAINANSAATDASQNMAANSPPAAAPTAPVQADTAANASASNSSPGP